ESRTISFEKDGEPMNIKVGRFGPYIVDKSGKEEVHASIPENIAPADLEPADLEELIKNQANGPTPIGTDPKTKEKIYCLVGRYGAYFQLGEVTEENPKPKRASLPKGKDPKTVTIEEA